MPLAGAADDFVRELLAQQRLGAEHFPRRLLQLQQLVDADGGMHNAVRVRPRRELLRSTANCALRREPERQLVSRVEMERAAQGPRLDERALTPQRVANVLLREPVDARRQLQLGGRLHLRVDSANLSRDVGQRRGAQGERAARESSRANLFPGQRNRRRSTSLPPVAQASMPRSMIWTCAADGSSSTCSSRY